MFWKTCLLYVYAFISIKNTSPDEGKLRAEELEILVHNFVVCLAKIFGADVHCIAKKHAPSNTFFSEIMNQIMSLNSTSYTYLQNMPIYYPSRKYKLPIRAFLEYCYLLQLFQN